MHMAYSRGADRIWIVNVGDLKPVEIPISHFMDMAYDAEKWDVDSVQEWSAAWAAREFGSATASEISNIMVEYGIAANRRKYELIEPESYSVINYDEGDRVLAAWADLESRAQAVYDSLDASAQPAFFQMVLHPVRGGHIVNQIYIGAAKNLLYAGQKRNAANSKMMEVFQLAAADSNLTDQWDEMLDGKWAHILDREYTLWLSCLLVEDMLADTDPQKKPTLAMMATGSSRCATACPPCPMCRPSACHSLATWASGLKARMPLYRAMTSGTPTAATA